MPYRLAIVLLAVVHALAWQQGPGPELRDAIAALQRSDFQDAEQKLRAEVAAHPDNTWAQSLLGAALDKLDRVKEAEDFHRRAAANAPRSAEILNNLATHLWLAGKEPEAAEVYTQIVAIEPAHFNANLQLARAALKQKNGHEALLCLDRLPLSARSAPPVALASLQALYLTGDLPQAGPLFSLISAQAKNDPSLAFAAGVALSNVERFAQAESLFEIALERSPADFAVLYNLGIAATRAGHLDRARDVLEAALRREPQSVDALYALAYVDSALRQFEKAVQLLSQAARLDPRHADVERLLALATTDLGALDDAAAAWDRYLKLAPGDDDARRERGYTNFQRGRLEEGIAELEWFASRHPEDATGQYELGQAERARDLTKAMRHFDRALEIDPNYVPALVARAAVHNQQGKPEDALADLEKAAARRPEADTLDRLGQTYAALDRAADAVRVLRQAAGLAPTDSKTLLHFARALADSGDTAESKRVMDRFRQLGPEKKNGIPGGFVDYLALSDDERHADYRARLEKAVREKPGDASLRLESLKLLVADGRAAEAAKAARAIAEMKPDAVVLAGAGRALLAAGQYALAADLLRQSGETGADLTIANRLSEAEKFAAAGDLEGALHAWQKALDAAPDRPDLYRQSAAFLVAHARTADAFSLIDGAARRWPKDRQILLLRAVAAELAGKSDTAGQGFTDLHARWPEWHAAWAADGMILARRREFAAAQKALETAVALGASGPEVYYSLAESALAAGDRKTADAATQQALRLAPEDKWIQALAARVADKPSSAPSEEPPYLLRLFH